KPDGKATVEVGDATFELVSKGANLWVKNAAEESQLVDAMRKGARMIVKAPSLRGNVTTDSYSLSGVSAALDRVEKECR
ncbi:MAG TPA: invasion associated locus B family protein, partial [Beijerinckiaceae bacterium]